VKNSLAYFVESPVTKKEVFIPSLSFNYEFDFDLNSPTMPSIKFANLGRLWADKLDRFQFFLTNTTDYFAKTKF
jgi:hypothetical protein